MKTQGNTHGEGLNPTKKQARLDYFLVSESIFSFVTDSDIVPGYRTDHSRAFMQFADNTGQDHPARVHRLI